MTFETATSVISSGERPTRARGFRHAAAHRLEPLSDHPPIVGSGETADNRGMAATPTYDALPAARRLEIERRLYQHIFEKPYAERSIPDEPTERQREYLISCIRDAIIREGAIGAVPAHEQDAARELTAREMSEGQAPREIVTRASRMEQLGEFMRQVCESTPHRLEDYLVEVETLIGLNADGSQAWVKEWAVPEQIVVPEGADPNDILRGAPVDEAERQALREAAGGGEVLPVRQARAHGLECGVLSARIKGIPRRRIAERYLKKLGYRHAGARGGTGYIAFEKVRDDGVRLGCEFDFGTWRQTVVALFGYTGGGMRFRTPLRYWREPKDVPIVTTKLFERTMENVAYVVGELERFLDQA